MLRIARVIATRNASRDCAMRLAAAFAAAMGRTFAQSNRRLQRIISLMSTKIAYI